MGKKRTAIIRFEDEYVEVDLTNPDIGELESAMRFKGEHIKAKADPELFFAVADMLRDMSNTILRLDYSCFTDCSANVNGMCTWSANYSSCSERKSEKQF